MKNISLPFRLLAACLTFSLLYGCGDSTPEQAPEQAPEPPTEVIKVEPQDFPSNEIPDSYFGKDVALSRSLQPGEANLKLSSNPVPAWLDAIISRESIVMFASEVMVTMPDEVEFVQATQKHYEGSDGIFAFKTLFTTRPSNANIFIYGAYTAEDNVYWTSEVRPEATSLAMDHASATDNGMLVSGKFGEKAFVVSLEKEAVTMTSEL